MIHPERESILTSKKMSDSSGELILLEELGIKRKDLRRRGAAAAGPEKGGDGTRDALVWYGARPLCFMIPVNQTLCSASRECRGGAGNNEPHDDEKKRNDKMKIIKYVTNIIIHNDSNVLTAIHA